MKTLKNPVVSQAAAALQTAIRKGNEKQINKGVEDFCVALSDAMKQEYQSANGNKRILMQRGYRVLTDKEKTFYDKWIQSVKSNDPKQAVTDLLDGGMPETIIEDVYRNLVNEHPLLEAISFTNVNYLTRWIMPDHTTQTAQWGPVNDTIKKEISTAFKSFDVTQCKLSCFTVIPKDMVELGPVFLDNYIRTFLTEALACGLENAIVSGTGKNMPIGLDKDVSADAAVVDGIYPEKEAIKVASFLPEEYGPLIAQLCKTESGRYRKIEGLSLICNPKDYYDKIMPATTLLNANGEYIGNVFPIPTNVYQSPELPENKAILCLPKEYFAALGSAKNGNITYDDSVQFLEDNRVYMIKLFANGRPYDNTAALVLDISDLKPAYITVLNKENVSA